uniref:Uncharacterized protein At3g49140 n=2 Tax=Anthurium amnicola TaxID=1678845 RepID=A0A1D1ZD07_9ARAE
MAIGLVLLGVTSSAATTSSSIRAPLDARRNYDFSNISFKCRDPFFGAIHCHWLTTGQVLFLRKVWATACYPDSVPNASKCLGTRGYHPLEELKDHERNKDMMLTAAEIARTTVETNSNALLIFPGTVHCEPHRQVSWGEFHYVADDYGDIFFEIFDDENILQDCRACSPVTVLIGMDGLLNGELKSMIDGHHGNSYNARKHNNFNTEDDSEVTEVSDILINWGMPETLRRVHPLYFAKCLTKAVHTKYRKKMEHPSNGLCIMGCLRPAFIDEESYLRRLFHGEDSDGYGSDWRDESEKEEEQVAAAYDLIDGEILSFDSNGNGNMRSSLYKLEITTIELFSVYGDQSTITLQDFQDAEPDVLAHTAPAIIRRFNDHGMNCSVALKSLCRKKKRLNIEGANLIGVDSLGMDVRVFLGMEAQTVRFSFNTRVMSETAAERKIRRMLFPRCHRKQVKISNDDVWDSNSC